MITWYNVTHKAYRLVDIATDKMIIDVVYEEEFVPFQTSPKFHITEKPKVVEDSSFKIQVAPIEGGGGRF
jgi:hypothetical protein